jgi:hypothetical protein
MACRSRHDNASDGSSARSSSSADGGDFEFTSDQFNVQLAKEQLEDPGAAEKKYAGKRVKLRGKVTGFGYTLRGEPALRLDDNMHDCVCTEPRPVGKAMPGQTVLLAGVFDQSLKVPSWEVVSAEGTPPPGFTADQLARELVTAPDKYNFKWMVLSGQINRITQDKGFAKVYLTPAGQRPEIMCTFMASCDAERQRNASFRVGDSIKAVGKWHTWLTDCEVVDPLSAGSPGTPSGSTGSPPVLEEPEAYARALLTWPTPLPNNWRFSKLKAGSPIYIDRKYAVTKISPGLENSVQLVRVNNENRTWLPGSTLIASQDCTVYAVVIPEFGGKVHVDAAMLKRFAGQGWSECQETLEVDNFNWKVLKKSLRKGENPGNIPEYGSWDLPTFFVIQRN